MGMKTRSLFVRLPLDLYDHLLSQSGKSFSDKLISFLTRSSDDRFKDMSIIEDRYHNMYSSGRLIESLVNSSMEILGLYYSYGFVDDQSRKYLLSLLDRIPHSVEDADPSFGYFCPPIPLEDILSPPATGAEP